MSFPLTPRETAVVRYIHGFQLAHGFTPTMRQIASAIGQKSRSSAHDAVVGAERRGRLQRVPGRHQSIVLSDPPSIPHAPDGAPLFVVPWLPGSDRFAPVDLVEIAR